MSLEFNKAAGALLGTLTFVLGVGFLGELIFKQEAPEKPGYEVAVADAAPAEDAAAPAADVEPIEVRLAKADVAKGEAAAKTCGGCHVLDSSNANKTGPGLYEIVNRKPASHEGFEYSKAMQDFAGTHPAWDYATLDAFLTKPAALVPKTKMGYAGEKKPEARANIIAYLRTLSANPAPLPPAP